mgnify:CR=1 FL=1
MPREKAAYRDNLELLLEYFGEKRMYRPFEVAQYLGVNVRTVKKRFEFEKGYITIVNLARALS